MNETRNNSRKENTNKKLFKRKQNGNEQKKERKAKKEMNTIKVNNELCLCFSFTFVESIFCKPREFVSCAYTYINTQQTFYISKI